MLSRVTIRAAAAGAVLIFAGGAHAADVRPASLLATPLAAPSWAGPYAGLFAGYGWGRATASSAFDANTGFFYNWTGNPYGFDVDGFFGGATAGFNAQSGGFVYGLEGEIGYLGLRGSAIDPNFQPGGVPIPDTETRFASDFYAGLYARGGVLAGPVLLYGKGGVAALNARASTIDPCGDGSPQCGTGTLNMTGSKLMLGWSAGAGAEWMLSPRWTAKVEYAYFDFGSIRAAGPSNVAGELYRQSISVRTHTVKLGWSYRFTPEVVTARH
jgi:outer membrane immunogenic protein